MIAIVSRTATADSLPAQLPKNPLRVESEYSTILVHDDGSFRSLSFVRDSGEIVLETLIDMSDPARLVVRYTQWMFASLLFVDEPKQALLLGLGGGAMVRFAEERLPDLRVDAVEIDPAIIQLANRYFGTRPGDRTRIVAADAFDFVRTSPRLYDIVFLDAFLKPSGDTDSTGIPTRMKGPSFYDDLNKSLAPGGAIAFNVNISPTAENDIRAIQQAFRHVYVFKVPSSGNLVLIATEGDHRVPPAALTQVARGLDQKLNLGFSLLEIVRTLSEPQAR